MATFIVLGQFTDQGIRNVKDTTRRAEAVRDVAKKVGASVTAVYWTLGRYDIATIIDAPDDAAATAFLLSVGGLGNVRTECLRAFSPDEMGRILAKVV